MKSLTELLTLLFDLNRKVEEKSEALGSFMNRYVAVHRRALGKRNACNMVLQDLVDAAENDGRWVVEEDEQKQRAIQQEKHINRLP